MDYLRRPDNRNKVVQMLPLTNLVFIDKQSATPIYQQIATGIVQQVRNGVLPPGSKLPGTRELAQLLQVHRKTAVAAYEELSAQSWIDILPRKGVYVAERLPLLNPRKWNKTGEAYPAKMAAPFYRKAPESAFPLLHTANRSRIVMDDGLPDPRIAPLDLLLREYRSLCRNNGRLKAIAGAVAGGSPILRQALVSYLSETRGLQAQSENILVTHGAQMSIYLAAQLLLRPGDGVVIAEPGYHLATKTFDNLGADIIRVPVDDNGMDMDAVEKACQKYKIRMLYVIPHHHHPTTVTLGPDRRMRLLALASEYNFAIVEDDYDYDYHYSSSPYLPLASSKHDGRIIYIGSFSKSLASSIRIGFLVGAEDFVKQAIYLRRMIDLKGDHLMEDALAALIRNGDVSRHLKKAIKLYQERRGLLCTLLETQLGEKVSFKQPSGGMAVWTSFAPAYPLPAIAARAAKQGLYMSTGVEYNSHKKEYNALRMGFASLTPDEIAAAVEIISKVATGAK